MFSIRFFFLAKTKIGQFTHIPQTDVRTSNGSGRKTHTLNYTGFAAGQSQLLRSRWIYNSSRGVEPRRQHELIHAETWQNRFHFLQAWPAFLHRHICERAWFLTDAVGKIYLLCSYIRMPCQTKFQMHSRIERGVLCMSKQKGFFAFTLFWLSVIL